MSRDVQGATTKQHARISHHGIPLGGCDSATIIGDKDVKKWPLQSCLRDGIGFGDHGGLRCRPWRSVGGSREPVLKFSEAEFDADYLPGTILSFRCVFLVLL